MLSCFVNTIRAVKSGYDNQKEFDSIPRELVYYVWKVAAGLRVPMARVLAPLGE
jgi:hypothetical protein